MFFVVLCLVFIVFFCSVVCFFFVVLVFSVLVVLVFIIVVVFRRSGVGREIIVFVYVVFELGVNEV